MVSGHNKQGHLRQRPQEGSSLAKLRFARPLSQIPRHHNRIRLCLGQGGQQTIDQPRVFPPEVYIREMRQELHPALSAGCFGQSTWSAPGRVR